MNSITSLGQYQYEWLSKYRTIDIANWRLIPIDKKPEWLYVGDWTPDENGGYEKRYSNLVKNRYHYWPQ